MQSRDTGSNNIMQKLDVILSKQTSHEEKLSQIQIEVREFKEILNNLIDENTKLFNENSVLKRQIDKNNLDMEQLKQHRFTKFIEISGIGVVEKSDPASNNNKRIGC